MLRLAAVVCLLVSSAVSAQKCAECGPAVHDAVGAAGYVIAVMHQATHVPGECHGPPAACVKNSPCELIWVLEIIVINPVPGGPYPPINVNSGGQNSTISYESEGLFQAVAYWSSGGGRLPCGHRMGHQLLRPVPWRHRRVSRIRPALRQTVILVRGG
jgi:hypothetical protein